MVIEARPHVLDCRTQRWLLSGASITYASTELKTDPLDGLQTAG